MTSLGMDRPLKWHLTNYFSWYKDQLSIPHQLPESKNTWESVSSLKSIVGPAARRFDKPPNLSAQKIWSLSQYSSKSSCNCQRCLFIELIPTKLFWQVPHLPSIQNSSMKAGSSNILPRFPICSFIDTMWLPKILQDFDSYSQISQCLMFDKRVALCMFQ